MKEDIVILFAAIFVVVGVLAIATQGFQGYLENDDVVCSDNGECVEKQKRFLCNGTECYRYKGDQPDIKRDWDDGRWEVDPYDIQEQHRNYTWKTIGRTDANPDTAKVQLISNRSHQRVLLKNDTIILQERTWHALENDDPDLPQPSEMNGRKLIPMYHPIPAPEVQCSVEKTWFGLGSEIKETKKCWITEWQ